MAAENKRSTEQHPTEAAVHVAGARESLKELQEKIGEHPELSEAITKLEMALSLLTLQTGGLL